MELRKILFYLAVAASCITVASVKDGSEILIRGDSNPMDQEQVNAKERGVVKGQQYKFRMLGPGATAKTKSRIPDLTASDSITVTSSHGRARSHVRGAVGSVMNGQSTVKER